MRRWVIILAVFLLAAAFNLLPFAGSDVASLQPVELLFVSVEEGEILVRADTGSFGTGQTVGAAFADMKERAASEIFLDTAEHLLITPPARYLLEDVSEYLRPACTVCIAQADTDLSEAAAYLGVHKPTLCLLDCRAGNTQIPTLISREGGMYLVP